jgi:murein L,D-transpeptidase YcbB/YkuD
LICQFKKSEKKWRFLGSKKVWIPFCNRTIMKFLFYPLLALAIGLGACTNDNKTAGSNDSDSTDTDSPDVGGSGKNVSKRDYSIDSSNSYSNLFFDSSALEKQIVDRKIDGSTARRMRSFYNARNYQYAWFASDGFTEQAYAFWNLYDYYVTYSGDSSITDKAMEKTMNALMLDEDLELDPGGAPYLKTEIAMTQHFIEYSQKNFEKGYVKRKELERFVPIKKNDPLRLADSILNKKHKDDKYFADINPDYKKLMDELSRYYQVAKSGGWPTITMKEKALKSGMSSPTVLAIKKRLAMSGDMAAGDTSNVYDSALVQGVRRFQQRHGYTPTGIVNAAILKDMNVSANHIVMQLLINMERMRWMPNRPSGNLIVVNIPEFILHMYDGKTKAFDMPVVVGKEGHNTVLFTGDLSMVVFSPYWNVPQSIVKAEILPGIQKNSNYLASHHMEKVGGSDAAPVIRQVPGPWNSLGLVKFLFPNSFNIYFHDTNAKGLFSQDKRAYSHGCIRLQDPTKMANYLLRNQPEWTPEKIDEAMNAGKEKTVKLKQPVPVFISYYTAWVDDEGLVNFRDDIYDHDKKMIDRAFVASQN